MTSNRPTSTPTTTETVRRDTSRILTEITGGKDLTDPFAAAVRATRMPMIITDPRQHDNPIIFVNEAFCRLTGYDRSDIIGRNCRFLQGPGSEIEAVTIAAYEVDAHRSGPQRLATVFDAAGQLILAYAGPASARVDGVGAHDDGG